MNCKNIITAVSLTLAFNLITVAQTPGYFEMLKQKYPGESSVITSDIENILIDVAGSEYRITQEVKKETMILKNPTNYMVTDKVYSSHFIKILDLDAKTLVPDGDKFKVKKVEKYTDQKNQSDYVFYDEVTAKTFVYPAVQPGAVTSLRYVQELSNPHILGSFFFKWHVPCELSRVTIKADKKASVKYKLFNTESSKIDFTVEEKGKYNIYTWTARNIQASDFEPDAPNLKYYYPHLAFYIDNSKPANLMNDKLSGLNGLFNYYHSLVKDINTSDDKAIKQEVENIISGATTETEKVKRLYYWVQDNIKYVAFEAGMQGFIPEPASQVFIKRYGDCKGMSSILNYMLKVAGIESYLTWVGTRDIPYRYTEIPSEITDNHMIVTYYHEGKPIFLDATNNHLPLVYLLQ
ncbi:MAG: DUF3857 and transglutaminase domain-containing protein [Bacteroidales bacterium]|nr:DUF3857 and transglutaminase domain-containing protein [Bacteroidales bacterium]